MKVTIEYSAQMKKTIGHAQEELDVGTGKTVCDIVREIAEREGDPLKSFLLDDGDDLGHSILLFLNDEQVVWQESPALTDGDVLTIATPIAGGVAVPVGTVDRSTASARVP